MIRPLRNAAPSRLVGGVLSLLCLAACKKGDKVPAYLDLSGFSVSTVQGEGSNSSNIPHSWCYVNDRSLGVWGSGARVPVLATGTVQLKFIAGVERNGVSTDLVQYPFYRIWSANVDLVPGEHTAVQPVFQYYPDLEFWIADFEDPAIPFTFDVGSDTDIVTCTDTAVNLPGNGNSGVFYLDTDHPRMKAICFETADLEGAGTTWLELDYRTDHRMLIGLYYSVNGFVVDEPYVYIAPSKHSNGTMLWKKIHIDLSPFTNASSATDRKFYIAAELGSGATNASFWIDNVKLVRL